LLTASVRDPERGHRDDGCGAGAESASGPRLRSTALPSASGRSHRSQRRRSTPSHPAERFAWLRADPEPTQRRRAATRWARSSKVGGVASTPVAAAAADWAAELSWPCLFVHSLFGQTTIIERVGDVWCDRVLRHPFRHLLNHAFSYLFSLPRSDGVSGVSFARARVRIRIRMSATPSTHRRTDHD
jgi:hypothetical protein